VGEHYYKIYTLSFYTIDAGIFLSAATIEHPLMDPLLLEQIHSALRQAILRLTIMKERSAMAKSGLQVLGTCYQKIPLSSQISTTFVCRNDLVLSHPSQLRNTQQYSMNEFSERAGLQVPQQHFQNISELDVYDEGGGLSTTHAGHLQTPGSGTLMNFSDFSASSSWMTQMDQMVDLDPGAPISDSVWSSLLG
jgi:hypothetical protein